MARVLDAIVSHRAGRLSCVEAGDLLGLSERHFRRLRDASEDRGEEGLFDRRRGRVSSSRIPEAEAEWLAEMFRTRYFDFTAKHFHEQVVGQPMAGGKPFHRSYSCVKSVLQYNRSGEVLFIEARKLCTMVDRTRKEFSNESVADEDKEKVSRNLFPAALHLTNPAALLGACASGLIDNSRDALRGPTRLAT